MIFGADFSTLEETEHQGGKFYEHGREVERISCQCGMCLRN